MAHLRTRQWLIIVVTGLVLLLIKPALSATPLVNTPTGSNTGNRVTAVNDTANNVRLLSHIGGLISVVHATANRVYISEGRSITILDTAQPLTPKVLGRIKPLDDTVKQIVVQNQYVYIVAGSAGFHIFDVTDPAAPIRVGFYDTPGDARGIFVTNNHAYVADGANGLRILNVTNPATISEAGFHDTPGTANKVSVVGAYAYVADGEAGLQVVNVANPAQPSQVGSAATPGTAVDIQVVGNYAYIGALSGGLRSLDISNPAAPSEIGFFDASWVVDISINGNYAYLADSDSGMRVVNVSNPATPVEAGFYSVRHVIEGADVVGDYAYVADWDGRLWVVDISTPTAPNEVSFYSTPKRADAVHMVGNYAYVANGSDGLHILNVVDPFKPTKVGFFDGSKFPTDVQIVGNYAYVTGYEDALRVVNISNPAAPVEVGATPGGSGYQYVYVANRHAYIADAPIGAGGFIVMNVENPAQPYEVRTYDVPGSAADVYVVNNYAYIATGDSGLRIWNVSNPAAASEVGFYNTPGSAGGVHVVGTYAYVADGDSGLRILDVKTPATPTEIGFYDTPGSAWGVFVTGNYAYVADAQGGLRIVDISMPTAPKEVGSYVTPDLAQSIYVVNNVIYLATGEGGLYLLRYPDCYRLTLTYSGSGGIPAATPNNAPGCSTNEYVPQAFVTLSASPAPGWRVANWTGTNNDRSVSLNNTVTMPAADHAVSVNYAPICYALTLTHSGTGSNPTVAPANSPGCAAGEYVAGAPISLQAAPGVGQTVGSWIGTAADGSAAMNNTLTMPAGNHTAGVAYVLACYNLILTHSGSGNDPIAVPTQSSGCPVNQYHYQEPINLSATPATGWQVSSWSGTVNNAATTATNSFAMLPNDHTVSVNYSELPTAGPGDIYEVDGACTRSRSIATDGSEVQEHTFHAVADADWVRFTTAATKSYRIEVQTPADSPADVNLEVYAQCEAPAFDGWNESFSPGARLDVAAPASGQVYVRLANEDANQAGDKVRYTISVRALNADAGNRALILVAGRLKGTDSLQKNIHNVTNAVYKLFQRNGYTDDDIWYLATDSSLPGYDAALSKESLHTAITAWAKDKVGSDGVLTLYLMDHGSPETFYLDELSGQRLSPNDLNSWLNELENSAPQVKINVFIEACQSGSFITNPGSISKAGRVVITSSNAESDARASKDGAYFSDHLLTWLHQDYNLAVAFAEASSVARAIFSLQRAMLDADGNGVPNEFTDSNAAAKRSFAYAGTLAPEWSPHIFAVQPPPAITNFRGVIEADVRDDAQVRQVWAVVYPPDYVPPPAGQELQPEVLPTFLLTALDNGNRYAGEFTGFTQSGTYRIIVHAEDNEGLVARPVVLEVSAGSQLYLPLVTR